MALMVAQLDVVTALVRVLSLALAAVLVFSAGAKLVDGDRSVQAVEAMGLPVPGVLAWLVPAAELSVAAALVLSPSWGGVLAFGLLAVFTAVLWSLVRSDSMVPCNCFGSVSRDPVSRRELGRNLALMTAAAVVALFG